MADYGYINARLKSMRASFITSKLDEVVNATSYGEFLRLLSETDIGPDLGEATAQGAGLDALDKALSRNFYNTTQKLAAMDGNSGDIGLLLARYDLGNLKAIARGKLSGRTQAEIEASLLPAGTLKLASLSALAASPDLGALAQNFDAVGHPLSGAFKRSVAQLASDQDLLAFEVALDQAYYGESVKRAGSDSLRGYLKREVDSINIMTALKLRAQQRTTDLERYFVKGGSEVTLDRFNQIVSGAGNEASSVFADALSAANLSDAETAVRGVLAKEAKRLYVGDALGAGVAVGFLKEKENEVALVRLIARAKFYGVPTETLKRELDAAAVLK